MLLRFQDRWGRGPFKPGMTRLWSDVKGHGPLAAFERFPDLPSILGRACYSGLHFGCAAVGGWSGLDFYFTESEQERLHALGYRVHRAPNSAVIIADDVEAVFGIAMPLKKLPRARRVG